MIRGAAFPVVVDQEEQVYLEDCRDGVGTVEPNGEQGN